MICGIKIFSNLLLIQISSLKTDKIDSIDLNIASFKKIKIKSIFILLFLTII